METWAEAFPVCRHYRVTTDPWQWLVRMPVASGLVIPLADPFNLGHPHLTHTQHTTHS